MRINRSDASSESVNRIFASTKSESCEGGFFGAAWCKECDRSSNGDDDDDKDSDDDDDKDNDDDDDDDSTHG